MLVKLLAERADSTHAAGVQWPKSMPKEVAETRWSDKCLAMIDQSNLDDNGIASDLKHVSVRGRTADASCVPGANEDLAGKVSGSCYV